MVVERATKDSDVEGVPRVDDAVTLLEPNIEPIADVVRILEDCSGRELEVCVASGEEVPLEARIGVESVVDGADECWVEVGG